jgi:hypothetical protein
MGEGLVGTDTSITTTNNSSVLYNLYPIVVAFLFFITHIKSPVHGHFSVSARKSGIGRHLHDVRVDTGWMWLLS